jgi:hypothetical protein
MDESKVRSRLKAQLTKFCAGLSSDLSKPLAKFVVQMLFGIQSSQDVKLSNCPGQRSTGVRLCPCILHVTNTREGIDEGAARHCVHWPRCSR